MPLIYLHGIAPGQYVVVTTVFVTYDDPAGRAVLLQVGLPTADMGPQGPVSTPEIRR